MTDRTNELLDNVDDLELITSYLNGHLDPERVEAVRRRLEEDATFRDLAAPLLLTWSVPTHLQRNPRPEGEWERDWEAFTQRVGIQEEPPAPRRRRRGWRYWGKLFGAGLIVYVLIALFQPPIVRERNYNDVPNTGGWFPLHDRIYVHMAPGAKVRLDWEDIDGMKHVLLEGSARFRVDPLHSASLALRPFALLVETSAGSVNIGEGEVSVVALADTTLVHAVPLPAIRRAVEPELRTVMAITTIGNTRSGVALFDGERARMVRGQHAQRALPNP